MEIKDYKVFLVQQLEIVIAKMEHSFCEYIRISSPMKKVELAFNRD